MKKEQRCNHQQQATCLHTRKEHRRSAGAVGWKGKPTAITTTQQRGSHADMACTNTFVKKKTKKNQPDRHHRKTKTAPMQSRGSKAQCMLERDNATQTQKSTGRESTCDQTYHNALP